MVCTTVTIPGSYDKVISCIYQGQVGEKAHFKVTLFGSGAGVLQTKVDGTIIGEDISIVKVVYDVYITLTSGTHTVCMGVYNLNVTTIWVCATVTIGQKYKCTGAPDYDCVQAADGTFATRAECLVDPACLPLLCTSISKDTWKPKINNPATGANLPIVVRSTDVNKNFNIGYADAVTLERHVLFSGTTDASGCYSGEIPAQADGTYKLTVCFLVLNIACPITAPIHPISITWGTKSLDLQTVVLIGAGILALAYVLGQRK